MNIKVLFSIFAAVAYANKGHSCSRSSRSSINLESKKCTRKLEDIVYNPESCANAYLKRISKTLEVQAPLLFADPAQAQAVMNNFQQKYGVNAFVMDAFGTYYSYPGGPVVTGLPRAAHAIERAFALGHAFSNTEEGSAFNIPASYVYASLLWSHNGEMYTLVVIINKNAGVICK